MSVTIQSDKDKLNILDYNIAVDQKTGDLYLTFCSGPLNNQYFKLIVNERLDHEEMEQKEFYVLFNFAQEYEDYLYLTNQKG